MKAQTLNRLAVILSFLGIFVAGVLSLGHRMNASIPCAYGSGCDTVANDPSSFVGGAGGLPVAYIGLAGYIVLAALSVTRTLIGGERSARLIMPGYVLAAIGSAVSLYLQYVSFTQIHAMCVWCLSSAFVMMALLVTHALLSQASAEEMKPGSKDLIVVVAAGLAVAVGLGGTAVAIANGPPLSTANKARIANAATDDLIPKDAHYVGPPDAKVTIVEFGDLMCPTCRSEFPEMQQIVSKHRGVRWVFRHLPLYKIPAHRLALPAAAIAEVAAEKGKFWDYVAAVYGTDEKELTTADELFDIASSLGLDVDECRKRITDEKDPAFQRVWRDIHAAGSMGIMGTPTIILVATGQTNFVIHANQLDEALSKPPYSDLLKQK